MLGDKWNTTVGNTNAQEGTGRDIKFTAIATKLSMFEVVDHLHRYARIIEHDIGKLITGSKIRYKRKKVFSYPQKKKTLNDGRPPDTTVHLLPKEQLTSQTPYKLAYIANITAGLTSANVNNPVETDPVTPFVNSPLVGPQAPRFDTPYLSTNTIPHEPVLCYSLLIKSGFFLLG